MIESDLKEMKSFIDKNISWELIREHFLAQGYNDKAIQDMYNEAVHGL